MQSDTLFIGVRMVADGIDLLGDLLLRDGVIADFGPSLGRPDGVDVIREDGAVLCPGLVDIRVDLGEPGFEYRETIASAAAGMAGKPRRAASSPSVALPPLASDTSSGCCTIRAPKPRA